MQEADEAALITPRSQISVLIQQVPEILMFPNDMLLQSYVIGM